MGDLTLDPDRAVNELDCASCQRRYPQVVGFVYQDGDAYALYHAQCHGHAGDRGEVWLDVVVGTWEEPELPGHATFSCRIGIDGAGLVDACCGVEGRAPYFGNKLSREMLSPTHDFPRSGTFWISS